MRTIDDVATEALSRHPLKLLSVIGKGPYSKLMKIFIAALTAERRNTATSMRSACVGEVKTLWATSRSADYNDAVNDAVRKLESLSIEKPKE